MTIHVQLDDWQQEALNHKGHLLLCTGRQSGKTFLMARKCSDYMLNHPNSRIIVVSLTQDQAELMIIMILDYLEKNHKKLIAKGVKKPTKRRVFLKNNAMVLARPVGNTGDAVRGFTGDILIIDEASRMPELAFTAAKPTLLTTGGEIWMCSTPFGKQGYFYECWLNKNKRFKVIHTNAEEVMKNRKITEVWTKKRREGALRLLEEEKKDMSALQYAQEYLGEFIDDLRQLFSDILIDRALTLKRPETIHREFLCFLGVDIGRMGDDSSTFEIIQRVNDNLNHVENIVKSKRLTTETYDTICDLERQWRFEKIGIDAGAGSLGVGILDFLLRVPIVEEKVVDLNNRKVIVDRDKTKTRLLKEAMYIQTQMLMEQGKLKLLDDENVRLAFKSVQYEYVMSPGEKTKIRIFSIPHNASDIVEGVIRAVHLANQQHLNIRIHWV